MVSLENAPDERPWYDLDQSTCDGCPGGRAAGASWKPEERSSTGCSLLCCEAVSYYRGKWKEHRTAGPSDRLSLRSAAASCQCDGTDENARRAC